MFGRKRHRAAPQPEPRKPRWQPPQPFYGYTPYPRRFWCSAGWYTCAHAGCQKMARNAGPGEGDDHDCCGRHRCGERDLRRGLK